jgi:hypothetical protein
MRSCAKVMAAVIIGLLGAAANTSARAQCKLTWTCGQAYAYANYVITCRPVGYVRSYDFRYYSPPETGDGTYSGSGLSWSGQGFPLAPLSTPTYIRVCWWALRHPLPQYICPLQFQINTDQVCNPQPPSPPPGSSPKACADAGGQWQCSGGGPLSAPVCGCAGG